MKTTFERILNGWIVTAHSIGEDELDRTLVFEDDESFSASDAESLSNAIWSVFSSEYQSKHKGGICVEYKDNGRSQEEN